MSSRPKRSKIRQTELATIASTLAHDLRTPLACLKGYLSLLDEGKYRPGSPEWAEFFTLCVNECDRMEQLVESLLESAVRDPEISLHCEPVLIPPLVNHVVAEVSAANADRRFVVDVHPDARIVWADPLRLEQVLRNLVDNAVKYSPDDTLVVIRTRKSGQETLFSVSDQGFGIPPEHLNRLFEKFYRVRDQRTAKVRGTGLGLPIARLVVEAHGGEIWAESMLERGSTFYFTLPGHDFEADCDGRDVIASGGDGGG